jgi:hypothetical protein
MVVLGTIHWRTLATISTHNATLNATLIIAAGENQAVLFEFPNRETLHLSNLSLAIPQNHPNFHSISPRSHGGRR